MSASAFTLSLIKAGAGPGFGLLPEDFPDAYLKIFDLTNGDYTFFKDDIAIPIELSSGQWA